MHKTYHNGPDVDMQIGTTERTTNCGGYTEIYPSSVHLDVSNVPQKYLMEFIELLHGGLQLLYLKCSVDYKEEEDSVEVKEYNEDTEGTPFRCPVCYSTESLVYREIKAIHVNGDRVFGVVQDKSSPDSDVYCFSCSWTGAMQELLEGWE